MVYNPEASADLVHVPEHLADWQRASPGQWFIGVVDTVERLIFLVPVNVFKGRDTINEETLANTNQRAINRYASGPHSTAETGGGIEHRGRDRADWATYLGGDWLESRPVGMTHHTGTALHHGRVPGHCLGFSLIKVAPTHFAQLKGGSNSLNGDKADAVVFHSFSRATFGAGADFMPGSTQLPPQWRDAILTYFRGEPFNLLHIVASND